MLAIFLYNLFSACKLEERLSAMNGWVSSWSAESSKLKFPFYGNSCKHNKSFLLLKGEIIAKQYIFSYWKILFAKTHNWYVINGIICFLLSKKNLSHKGTTSYFHSSSFWLCEMAKVHFCLIQSLSYYQSGRHHLTLNMYCPKPLLIIEF